MDDLETFNETSLPEKEDFYSHLNIEDIRVCKDFEIKNLVKCHDLYLKSDTLLLIDVFEKFRKICLEIYLQKNTLENFFHLPD